MFDGVARRYDITNTVLSLGQDRYWRRATRAALQIGPGDAVLDLAAGTAVSTVELAESGAWCVAADFSVGMLAAGAARPVPKVAGDATKLPFADGVFDAVTISFGLRNVVDHVEGLREMARVTRPGGRLVVCEFSTPTNPLFGTVYKEYLMQALPSVARRCRAIPTPTSIWPSRSGPGRIRRRWPGGSPTPAGRRCGGATSPAASSRCTPPPSPDALELARRQLRCELGAGPDAELAVDLGQVRLDGLEADEERRRHVAVRHSRGCQLGDLLLGRR